MKRHAVEDLNPRRASRGAVMVLDDNSPQEGSSYNLLSNVASAAASPNGEQHVSSSNETSTDGDSEDSSEDQGEQLSQAASDVAVVVVPRSNNGNNGNNSNTNKAAVASGQQQQKQNHSQRVVPGGNNNRGMNNNGRAAAGQQVPLSFANPKNFAERLMNVLDSGVISDCIWWATDGMAVALHPKKLRKGTVLQDHFSSSSYSGFLRNFNRWGFRRVPYSTVSDGAVTYKNSLFQRDQPGLVKHMRMDSDVQDLFERHKNHSSAGNSGRSSSDSSPPVASVGPTVASYGPSSAATTGNQNQQQHPKITTANGLQQLIASLQGQANIPSSIGGSMSNNGQAQSPQQQQGPTANDLGLLSVLQNSLNPSVVSSNGSSNNNCSGRAQNFPSLASHPSAAGGTTGGVFQQLQSLMTKQQEQQKQQQLQMQMQAILRQANNGSHGSDGGLASAVAALVQQIQQGNSPSLNPAQQQQEPSPEVIRQNLLLKIVESSQAYVNQPQPNTTRGMAISTCIKLLLVLGMQELNQEAVPSNATSSA